MKLMYIRYLIDMKVIGLLFGTILFLTSSAYSANLLTMDENSLVEHNSIEAIVATNAQTDECLLSVAHLGKYSSMQELKECDSYATLCENYPMLASINELSVDMPKAAAVSATIKNQATAQAKAKFGSQFVKAVVVESDWHVYTDPNNFNRTDHRSIDVDVIIKDGGEYYVSHQMLWQYYQAGKWGNYDMRQKSHIKQKVNYK